MLKPLKFKKNKSIKTCWLLKDDSKLGVFFHLLFSLGVNQLKTHDKSHGQRDQSSSKIIPEIWLNLRQNIRLNNK